MNGTSEAGLFRQIGILFQRDTELLLNDKKRMCITLILPVVIGMVISFVADADTGKLYESTRAALFTIICAGIYVGMFNSLPLICKERHIIKREYMTGMRISSYIIAMTLFQAIISLVQTLLFMAIYWNSLDLSKMLDLSGMGKVIITGSLFVDYTISLFMVMFASDMIGLLISALVRTNELANLIAPIIIIFQLVMSGVLFELSGVMEKVAGVTVSKWGMQAMGSLAGLDGMRTAARDTFGSKGDDAYQAFQALSKSKRNDINNPDGMDAYTATSDNLLQAWMVMGAIILLLAILCVVFLRRVEKGAR